MARHGRAAPEPREETMEYRDTLTGQKSRRTMLRGGRLVRPLLLLISGVIITVGLFFLPWITRGPLGVSHSSTRSGSIATAVPSTGAGLYDRGIQVLDEAIRRNPYIDGAYYNAGLTYVEPGQYERAIQDYDKAIRLNPNDAPAYYNRGSAHFYLGHYERAIEDYDEAIRLNPSDVLA